MSNRYKARELAEKYNINVIDKQYRENGKWYHHLENFPAAYFDKNGYIIFKNKSDYLNWKYLQLKKDVNITKNGISSIPGYIFFDNLKMENKI